MADKDKGESYPIFRSRVTRELRAHEKRLDEIDAELVEQEKDIAAMTDLCLRARQRLRSRVRAMARRKRRGETGRRG